MSGIEDTANTLMIISIVIAGGLCRSTWKKSDVLNPKCKVDGFSKGAKRLKHKSK